MQSELFPTMSESTYRMVVGGVDLIAGSAGGIASVLMSQPLDTVKVKVQCFPGLYPTAWSCLSETFTKDGLRRGLYAGMRPALVANVAENSVLFCAYGACQKVVADLTGHSETSRGKNRLTPLDHACAGFLASFFSSFTLCPAELIKCKLQSLRETGNGGSLISPFQLTRQIIRKEGFSGMFCGLTSTIGRSMPGYFFFFGSYETMKEFLSGGHEANFGLHKQIISGGTAGVASWLACFPFDVVKSRIQIESSRDGVLKVMRRILRQEGLRALYAGIGPTLVRTIPASGAQFVAYEYTKNHLTWSFHSYLTPS